MQDFTKVPYFLSQKAIESVRNKVANMSISEKIGQLFFVIGIDGDDEEISGFVKKYKPGGMMYRPDSAEKLQHQMNVIQETSDIPLFLAANLESGGNGIINEGTWVGNPLQIAATDEIESAYQLGRIASYEANQVGCNMSFSPIVDVDLNFRNPITNTRTFGSDKNRVLKMAEAQIRGLEENKVIPCIKHFPGDGVDERDQHLLSSVNSLSADEWTDSFGDVYKTLIEQGVPTIMVGHIFQPAWERKLQPSITDRDLRPASASRLLIDGLLRRELGFNGLAITDATAMVGYNTIMPRQELLIETINAGIDMILFNKNIDEDYATITEAVSDGRISMKRLDQAVSRIIATKLSQNVMNSEYQIVHSLTDEITLEYGEFNHIVAEIAKKSVTLVKDREQILPISPAKTPRVRLVVLGDTDDGGFKQGGKVTNIFYQGLENLGFEVKLFEMDFHEVFEEGIADLQAKFDLAIYVANIENASNQTTTRLNWIQLMAANAPWFSPSIPTVFVSTANPYHLFDVPYISTYINAYCGNPESVDAVLRKLVGEELFEGISPVDPFCGDFQAKL